MHYGEYDPAILKKLQKVQTEILVDFNILCEENGIDYFAIAGTLLGVVRHKGFIPWDDDIDIGMTRENYEKFLAVADNAFDGKYRIINHEIDPKVVLMFTKWYKVGTLLRDKDAVAMGYKAGISIDILSFEQAPNDEKKRRRQSWLAWFWGKLFILRGVGKPTVNIPGFKAKLVSVVSLITNGALCLFHISPELLYRKAMKAAMKYNGENTDYFFYTFDTIPHLSELTREELEPTKWADFEDIKLKIPNKPKRYLEGYPGDYMAIPPKEERYNHPPIELDFGNEE